ncbi:ectonucleotide pyrophosphatase/phosphodiesterase family member 5-like [Limulus polyphemus]|uniref:Ectonucleotide pyrophosphatase/phosphodiesterase family member 5-like n=1 Tax=Limulus polyphemus TaxID=6850 RepID=A0ABM1TIE1_LIMPO|nr:ectonucleotide pyrophosphatase/phosphodiesterase family member 5-like [Limulus polyphemus]
MSLPKYIVTILLSTLFILVDLGHARHKLLLVSFDGFRYDYIGKYKTPNFDRVAQAGVRAQLGVQTAFVTKTFPDHYTIATGLYEESHGIVSNTMYDPKFNTTFDMKNLETRWWDGGEPIWTTAKLQGVKVGSFFWPGSEVLLKNVKPNICMAYNKSTPFKARVDITIGWLSKKNVDLAVLYFHEPDSAGHKYGAFSSEVEKTVKTVDETLGYILDKLEQTNLLNKVNLILVSDHGMTNVTLDSKHIIALNESLELEQYVQIIADYGPVAAILPKKDKEDLVYNHLKTAHPNMTVYRKKDIPNHFHYKNHRRIMPIIAVADEGYYIVPQRPQNLSDIAIGQHGYDNRLRSMRPLFLARGPNFKKNFTIKSVFNTVNIYPMLCYLLNIKPAPNNGSLEIVKEFLHNNSSAGPPTMSFTLSVSIVVSMLLIFRPFF